jgi:ribonucleoside-diphosphate reductase alpha subunit
MYVIKRDQTTESVNFEKIAERIRKLVEEADLQEIDVGRVTQEIVANMSDKMHTADIDTLAANVCVAKQLENPEYERLATRLTVSNIHKTTASCVKATYSKLKSVLDPAFYAFVVEHADALNAILDQDRDYDFDYFGVSTMTKLYCAKVDDVLVERPGHVYLRVACVVSRYDLAKIRRTYDILSTKQAVFGSPTLFNAGMRSHQLASCFLMTMDDSIDGIFETFSDMAKVSKLGGGIGVNVSDVRSRGAPITSTNGKTDGLLPMVRCVNSIAQYVNQSSKRKGAIAVYIGTDHPDILDLLDIRRPGGDETKRARDIFLALMVSDLFMERLKQGASWSLFDPFECPGLSEAYGDAYKALYEKYESAGKAKVTMPAKELWDRVCRAQIESGVPYILYKDSINQKSNQKNLGTIKCSNLCAEIVQYSDADEIAVCNLGSVCLSQFVTADGAFDYMRFMDVVRVMATNLDSVIDANLYPTEKTRRSNMRHRPIGLGIQGLYDCLIKMGIPYDSEAGVEVSRKIGNAMYFAAIDASCDLAKVYGPYETYEGSPMSKGKMQFDLWGVDPDPQFAWSLLSEKVRRHGVRNSLSVCVMPTASSSQICGNVEAAEPITSLVYVRRTLAGEHVCLYRPLVDRLVERGLWTEDLVDEIIRANGSIQHIRAIPEELRRLFVTAWDIKQKWIIDHAAARAPFVCQTQSMNIFMSRPTIKTVQKMHAYGHAKGLKTGMYYLRTKSATTAAQISVSKSVSVMPETTHMTQTTVQNEVSDDDESVCLNCSG